MRLKKIKLPPSSFIISDNQVGKLYGHFLKAPLITFSHGEKSKSLKTIEKLAEQLVKKGADCSSTLVALGGGVVGDITGFLASIYMRGIDYIQIPTTLLAMTDSSIGGKTGIDLKVGKNLLGTFYQPKKIYIDPQVLKTLPKQEWQVGMAEIIKHAIIDGKLFHWLSKNKEKIKNQNEKTLEQLIYKNRLIKERIVKKDEKEKNIRAILNLGHTYGHALETLSNYRIPHGQAVSLGLVQVAKLAKFRYLNELITLLEYFNLPTRWPRRYKNKDVVKQMYYDKKTKNKKITLIVPYDLGKVKIVKNYPLKKILKCLNQLN